MVGRTLDWKEELGRWLKPFLDRLGHKARRQMCPLYVSGLIGPGDRKSIQPMAERLALGEYDQLHHFIAAGVWDAAPVETELLVQADRLVGGSDAVLVIDDTAIPRKGTHSVGVAPQYASALGKTANCQMCVADACARRSTDHAGVAVVSSRELDEQARPAASCASTGCGGCLVSSSEGSRRRPCCHRPTPPPCCSGRCSLPVKSPCERSTAGKRSPPSPSISRLTSQPEAIPSCYRRSRHTEFQPHS